MAKTGTKIQVKVFRLGEVKTIELTGETPTVANAIQAAGMGAELADATAIRVNQQPIVDGWAEGKKALEYPVHADDMVAIVPNIQGGYR